MGGNSFDSDAVDLGLVSEKKKRKTIETSRKACDKTIAYSVLFASLLLLPTCLLGESSPSRPGLLVRIIGLPASLACFNGKTLLPRKQLAAAQCSESRT